MTFDVQTSVDGAVTSDPGDEATLPLPLWALALLAFISISSVGAGIAMAVAGASQGIHIGAYLALAVGAITIALVLVSVVERRKFIHEIDRSETDRVEQLCALRARLNEAISQLANTYGRRYEWFVSSVHINADEYKQDWGLERYLAPYSQAVMSLGASLDAELVGFVTWVRTHPSFGAELDQDQQLREILLDLNVLGHRFAASKKLLEEDLASDARDVAWLGDRKTANRLLGLLLAISPSEPVHLGRILR